MTGFTGFTGLGGAGRVVLEVVGVADALVFELVVAVDEVAAGVPLDAVTVDRLGTDTAALVVLTAAADPVVGVRTAAALTPEDPEPLHPASAISTAVDMATAAGPRGRRFIWFHPTGEIEVKHWSHC